MALTLLWLTSSAKLGNVGPPPSAMRVHRSIATQALRYHQLGPPEESLRLETVQLPTIGPRDALVEFLAVNTDRTCRLDQKRQPSVCELTCHCIGCLQAPINPADLNIIEGKYPLKPPLPAVAGMEGVAVVCETGSEVFRSQLPLRALLSP